jgi:ribose transport system substrate-binding protein
VLQSLKWLRPRFGAAAALAAVAVSVSACGSSGSSSSSSSSGSAGAGSSTAAASTGTAGLDKQVVAGVPTLAQLYKGTQTNPPTSGPAAVPDKKVIWISCGQAAAGCSDPAAGAQQAAKALGWNYSVLDGKFDANGAWTTAILQAIAEKPDAIILHGIDCDSSQPAIQAAKKAGIAVICTVGSLDCSATGSGPSLYAANVIPNATSRDSNAFFGEFGAQKAAYIIDKTGGKAKVIDMHLTGEDVAVYTGFESMLKKCSGCSTVADIPYTGAQQTASGPLAQDASTAIARNPDANAMTVSFDTILGPSGGVGQELATIPAAKKMVIVGGEGTSVGMDMLRTSTSPLTAENGYDNDWIGWATMDALNRYFAHQAQVPEGFGTQLVDRQHNLNSSGTYATALDYRKTYEKVWNH